MKWSDSHPISPTSFAEFEQCPKKFYHRNIARDYPFEESEHLVWGRAVHKAIELRLSKDKPLAPNMEIFEPFCLSILEWPVVLCERDLGMTWEGEARDGRARDCAVKAKGDIIVMDAAFTNAMTIDIKTGKPREEPFQLHLQSLVLQAHYPTLKSVKGAYYWTQEGRLGPVYDVTGCWDKAMPRLYDMADAIDAIYGPPVVMEKFVAVPGDPFPCKWCSAPCEYAGGK